MDPVTLVKLEDVNGQPVAKISGLPTSLRVGDPLGLDFWIRRHNEGREEVLHVHGQFRITSLYGFDASSVPSQQLIAIESTATPPKWRSVKKASESRPLAPAISPRTPI